MRLLRTSSSSVLKISKHRDFTDSLGNHKSFPGQCLMLLPIKNIFLCQIEIFLAATCRCCMLSLLQWISEKSLACSSFSFRYRTALKFSLPFPSAGWKSPVASALSHTSLTPSARLCCLCSGLSLSCSTELKTELTFGQWMQMWLQGSQVKGSNHFPWSAGYALASATQPVVSASSL